MNLEGSLSLISVADLGVLLKSECRHMNSYFFSPSFDNNHANSCGLADGQLKEQLHPVRWMVLKAGVSPVDFTSSALEKPLKFYSAFYTVKSKAW